MLGERFNHLSNSPSSHLHFKPWSPENRKPTASEVHDWNKVALSIQGTVRKLLSTDMVRAGHLVQVCRDRVIPGMGLGNEGPGQAGGDLTVAFHHGQAPWSATEGAPSWQWEPVVPLPHLTEFGWAVSLPDGSAPRAGE